MKQTLHLLAFLLLSSFGAFEAFAGKQPYRLEVVLVEQVVVAVHLLGFVRFQELESGILFSEIHPNHHVLPILGEHFSDRLPEENFMIYDANRDLALLHPAGEHFFLADADKLDLAATERLSANEAQFQSLWVTFFHSITIDARKNPALQSQMIPKRFQRDAVEFQAS